MHSLGVIHCEIKPDNIVVAANQPEKPVLLDFELSKEADKRVSHLVATSTLSIGSLAYIAPELASGNETRPTGKTDVFALGRVFYELFYPGALSPHDRIPSSSSIKFPSIPGSVANVDLEDLLISMLEDEPQSRATASEALKHAFFKD